jgi:hypothetical protein
MRNVHHAPVGKMQIERLKRLRALESTGFLTCQGRSMIAQQTTFHQTGDPANSRRAAIRSSGAESSQ